MKKYNYLLIIFAFVMIPLATMSQTQEETVRIFLKNGNTVDYKVNEIDKIKCVMSNIPDRPEQIEFVDLGLSVKWATANLGASSYKDKGDLYAYGELETKKRFLEGDYTYPKNLHPTPGVKGYDSGGISGSFYDVALQNIGKGSRIPREDEIVELYAKCDIEKIFMDDCYYLKFTGPSGNYIYFDLSDKFWLHDGSTNGYSRYAHPGYSYANDDWNSRWIKKGFEGLYIRPVKETEVDKSPEISFNQKYNATFKRNELYVTIDSESMEKYNFEGSYYDFSDVGLWYSRYPDIKSGKEYATNKNLTKNYGAEFICRVEDIHMPSGQTYYVLPYVVVGGVYYYGNEYSFVAGKSMNDPVYNVGDYYPNSQNPIGVVGYVESYGTHGLVISLDETECSWDRNSFPDYKGANSGDNGQNNTKRIGTTSSPACSWCTSKGDEWYFPARFELTKLSKNITAINKSLNALGYTSINSFYWSSTEYGANAQDLAYIVCLSESKCEGYDSGWSAYNSKSITRKVRAMKSF